MEYPWGWGWVSLGLDWYSSTQYLIQLFSPVIVTITSTQTGIIKVGINEALGTLEWSQRRLSRVLGVHHQTVFQWCKEDNAPRYAMAYLGLAISVKNLWNLVDSSE